MKYFSVKENHLFSKAYHKGKKAVCGRIVVYVMPDYRAKALMLANPAKKKINRTGITVTKRIGKAVKRSRCRRIIREAYRMYEREHTLKKGYIIIFVARDSAAFAKSTDIKKDMEKAFKALEMTA